MPPAIIGAAIVGTAALGSAAVSSKAAKKAATASNYAADQNAAVNREIYNQTRTDLSSYNQAGQAGLAGLLTRLGLSPVSTTPGKTPGGPAGTSPVESVAAPRPDYQAYWNANPDLAANGASTPSTDLTGDGKIDDADRAAKHYQEFGQSEGRTLPAEVAPAGPAPTQAAPDAQRPQDQPLPVYTRSSDAPAPDIGSFFSNFQADPGYQFRLSEALRGVNAASAVRGKLRSGDAVKALMDRSSDLASQEYNNWFNRQNTLYRNTDDAYRYGRERADRNFLDDRSYGTNLALTNRSRGDNLFSQDRDFRTGREDQAVSNLFGLVGIGQNAAAGTASAGNVFAQNAMNSNNQRAATTANAAIANSQNISNLFGSAANAAGTYFGSRAPSMPRSYSI